ncbi:MAG TPA: CoA transferase, partial [Gammaproteobacteria bacterium]|nr:CoA transferase [Gammaproteobacteria bacterium]
MPDTNAPLAGITVIDCSRVLAGPYCCELLSFLGADVIKIESHAGDEGRTWPPHKGDMGSSFLGLNANKRSIAVDLKTAQGVNVVKDLARGADVLVENFKTGDMERYGLGYHDLKTLNPRLIYTAVSAFGRQGPKAKGLGYEALLQAYSGVLAITGEPGGMPVRCGVSFLDMGTGVMAALATVTALFRREFTGEGGKVESSLLGTSLGLMSNTVSNFLQHGYLPERLGTAHPQV